MLTLSRLGVIGNLQRIACSFSTLVEEKKIQDERFTGRCASTIALDPKIDDFTVKNEPVLSYLPGSQERKDIEAALKSVASTCEEVPIIIGGQEYRTKDVRYQPMPHNHKQKIAKFYYATPELVKKAIDTAVEAQRSWDLVPLKDRITIWLKAADAMATKYRQTLNATTMLGQSKTVIQAEIDAAAELIDFIRLNAFSAKEVSKYQPISPDPATTINSMRYRGLEGFIAAVSPFNFTAIGGNLAYTPALMGCSTLWKPSDTALLSNYTIYKIMTEAGVPPGVVNFVPADGPVFGDNTTSSPYLAGINFTGSVPTFNRLWTQVGQNINSYRTYPRLIGECGGKNFHFIHPSADVETVVPQTIRSAFEFCGQKCSACSRLYVPSSLWDKIKSGLLETRKKLKVGNVSEFDTFMAAVIDEKAFNRIKGYIEQAKSNSNLEVIGGGKCDNSVGYFIEPTIVVTKDPREKIMTEEIFGPVLTVYVYPDKEAEKTLELVDSTTPYALTGAVFAKDMEFQKHALNKLRNASGNYYINDKSTGSVVGQQPFGGSRMSGTNDKAGGPHYILRWASPQAIKETFVPIKEWSYPYMTK